MEGGGAPQDGTSHPSAPHLAPGGLRGRMAAHMAAAAPLGPRAPAAGRQRREGATARPRLAPVSRGAARGGRRSQEGVGWVAAGAGKLRERGREANKRSLRQRGREKRSALPNAQKPCW